MTAFDGPWALILGASSGFGAATAIELARSGYGIFGVHLDRRDTLPHADAVRDAIAQAGAPVHFFNVNAGDAPTMLSVCQDLRELVGRQRAGAVRVLLHSIAFGTLRRFVADTEPNRVTEKGMDMTLHLMANTLIYWTQAVIDAGLMGHGGRIFAMTSSGSHRVWHRYGPVSAAKAALESHIRQLALELAPRGITANAIQAGVTDTPALRKIPRHQDMLDYAMRINPHGRLTTPEDVAKAIVVLADERTQWMTGNVICVDGGEDKVG